jgi:hypothetical protein
LVSIKKISKQLNLEGENIFIDKESKTTTMVTHPEIKGFVSTDNKKFIFDCSAFTPRDLNFLEKGD